MGRQLLCRLMIISLASETTDALSNHNKLICINLNKLEPNIQDRKGKTLPKLGKSNILKCMRIFTSYRDKLHNVKSNLKTKKMIRICGLECQRNGLTGKLTDRCGTFTSLNSTDLVRENSFSTVRYSIYIAEYGKAHLIFAVWSEIG